MSKLSLRLSLLSFFLSFLVQIFHMIGAFSRTRFSCDCCASGPELEKKKKKEERKRKKHVDANRHSFLKRQYQCCFPRGCPRVQRVGSRCICEGTCAPCSRALRCLSERDGFAQNPRLWCDYKHGALSHGEGRGDVKVLPGVFVRGDVVVVFLCFPSAAGARAHNPIPFISVG